MFTHLPMACAGILGASLWVAGAARAADAVAVVPSEKICAYEKWKKVSFNGYFDAQKVSCRGTKNKRTGSTTISACSLMAYGNAKRTGASVKVWIEAADGEKKASKIIPPAASYKAEDLKIHDHASKLIAMTSKVRFTGQLRKNEECQMDVSKLDVTK